MEVSNGFTDRNSEGLVSWNHQHQDGFLSLQKTNIDISQSPKTAKPRNEKVVCGQIQNWSHTERPWRCN